MTNLKKALELGFPNTSFSVTDALDHLTKKTLYFVRWIDGPLEKDIEHYCSTDEYVLRCNRYLSSKLATRLSKKINEQFKENVVEIKPFPLVTTINTDLPQNRDGFILFPRIEMRANADSVAAAIETELASLT